MTGYSVRVDGIDVFATILRQDFGPRATTILNNVKNTQLHYADFGPIVAMTCSEYWFSNYRAILQHVSSIAENIEHASTAFHETAATYRSTDDYGRAKMDVLAEDLGQAKGTTLDPKSAPKDAPADGAGRDMSNSYYEKPGERTNYGDRVVKSLPGFSGKLAQSVTTKTDDFDLAQVLSDGYVLYSSFASDLKAYTKDPLGFLISSGLGFVLKIFTPLKYVLDLVASGNPDAFKAASSRFADIAKDLERLATDIVGTAQQNLQHWEGDAAVAAAAKLDLFVKGIHGTAAAAGGMAGGLQLIAMLSQALEDTVVSIISDIVKWAIFIWIEALATEVPTAGASTLQAAGETEAAVSQGAEKATEATTKVASLLGRVGQMFNRMGTKILQNDSRRAKFLLNEDGKKFLAPTLKGEAIATGKRLVGKDGGTGGMVAKGKGYLKSVSTVVDDNSIGTDESDEVIDEQLNFGQ